MAVAVVVAVVVAVDDLVVVVVGIVAAVLETDVAAAVVPPSDNPDIHSLLLDSTSHFTGTTNDCLLGEPSSKTAA